MEENQLEPARQSATHPNNDDMDVDILNPNLKDRCYMLPPFIFFISKSFNSPNPEIFIVIVYKCVQIEAVGMMMMMMMMECSL